MFVAMLRLWVVQVCRGCRQSIHVPQSHANNNEAWLSHRLR